MFFKNRKDGLEKNIIEFLYLTFHQISDVSQLVIDHGLIDSFIQKKDTNV